MEKAVKQLVDEGQYDKALELLNSAIADNPTDDELLYLRGFLYKQLGRWGESLTDLSKAIEINPHSRAVVLRQLLQEIVDYRYTDILNP